MTNLITLIGEVDDEMLKSFIEQLQNLPKKSKSATIILTSTGGDPYIALAIYHLIKNSPIEFHIQALGMVGSAAVLILAAGDIRSMPIDSHIMLHENAIEEMTAYTADFKTEAKQLEILEFEIAGLLEKNSKVSISHWMSMSRGTKYINARRAEELGLIDLVMTYEK